MIDSEFGEIKIRRNKLSRNLKLKIDVDGKLCASIPYYSTDMSVKRFIRSNRSEIRKMMAERISKTLYTDGERIGKSHTLIFRTTSDATPKITIDKQQIIAQIPKDISYSDISLQNELKKYVVKALRKQAKAYLPRRVSFLAEKYNFHFQKIRFSHTSTRWGSCSSTGTISLNIALMNLPHHLIDYVIIHELCHTRQMNHSKNFWDEVEKYDKNYKKHIQEIKHFSPII